MALAAHIFYSGLKYGAGDRILLKQETEHIDYGLGWVHNQLLVGKEEGRRQFWLLSDQGMVLMPRL